MMPGQIAAEPPMNSLKAKLQTGRFFLLIGPFQTMLNSLAIVSSLIHALFFSAVSHYTQSRTRYSFFELHRRCLGSAHRRHLIPLETPTRYSKHLCVGIQELQERYRLSSTPKIGTSCPKGTEKVSCPQGNKNRANRGIKFEKSEQLLPFEKLRLTECDLIFSTHASERTSDSCVFVVELDKITGCLAYLQQ